MRNSKNEWDLIGADQIKSLRSILVNIATRMKKLSICEEASIHEYDLRNFLSGNSERPRANVGVRLLAFVARQPRDQIPSELLADYDVVIETARTMLELEADDDFFFRYLDKIRAMSVSECRIVAKVARGNYYAYRLSNKPDVVLRSHLTVKQYSPFDRLPHFINLAKFGSIEERVAPMRRVEGQVLSVNNTYILVGFVFDNFEGPVGAYKGLNVCIVPSADLQNRERPIKGLFVSFTHGSGDRYEYGPICLMRTREEFKESGVGEFPLSRLGLQEPALVPEDLKYDLKPIQDDNGMLAACLSLAVFGGK
jgi:hypothetical protein